MLKYSALAAIAFAAATPAFAQEAPSLSGGHIEAIAGWDHGKFSGVGSDDGILFGVGAGYDFNLTGTFVFGIEGEAALSTVEIAGADAKRDLYAGVRVGTEVAPGTLLYAKVGYTNQRIAGFNADGLRVGGGLEHRFSNNLFVKGEYRYSNYELGGARSQLVAALGVRF